MSVWIIDCDIHTGGKIVLGGAYNRNLTNWKQLGKVFVGKWSLELRSEEWVGADWAKEGKKKKKSAPGQRATCTKALWQGRADTFRELEEGVQRGEEWHKIRRKYQTLQGTRGHVMLCLQPNSHRVSLKVFKPDGREKEQNHTVKSSVWDQTESYSPGERCWKIGLGW